MGRGDASVLVMHEDGSMESGQFQHTTAKVRQNWVVAGDTTIMCEGNQVTARQGDETVWEHTLDGIIMGAAVANGSLVLSTTDGAIHCFRSQESGVRSHAPQTVGPGTKTWKKPEPGAAADDEADAAPPPIEVRDNPPEPPPPPPPAGGCCSKQPGMASGWRRGKL